MADTLILNVDDVAAHRYAKTRILEASNYKVVEAGTAAEALNLVAELWPDLVLLDINLPDMNGMDVCRAIKSTRLGSRIAVVHITSTSVGQEYETASLEHGADAYLAEPVETQTLLTVIGLLLRLRRTEAGLARSEERLRLATEAAGIATWEIDLSTGIAVWSGELFRMLGYEAGAVRPSWSAWQARIHPDDRARVSEALRRARDANGVFREEHRIVRTDGGELYVAPFGKVYGDGNAEPARILGVLIDLTERQKAEAERERLLREANASREEAERANRLKDDFLASLSHELRTPMHAMLGWIQLMRLDRMNEDERKQALETIERNARLQNQLINELLDVSRAISGKLEVEIGDVRLEEVLLAALDSVRPMAEAKRIELTHSLRNCLSTIPADPSRLQQILGNLLSNAVKFTPAGGWVKVECDSRDGDVHIVVTDNGEGIAPEVLPHVFEAFRQADGSITRRHGGLGLGLSIVQRLVQLHGGTVRAESAGLGCGSTFTVTLPAAGATASLFATSVPRPVAATGLRLHGITVLAVDDNEDVLQLMQEMLQWEGASVHTATTAASALQLACKRRPDLLVLDIGMPDMNGYELLNALRAELAAGDEHLPAIAVTGYASAADARRAAAAGFQAHLAKPFEMAELFTLVEALAPPAARRPA